MTLGSVPGFLKASMRSRFLSGLKGNRSLDHYELDLFRWFASETEAALELMSREELKAIHEQIEIGFEEINDSGVLAVEYYRKRVRFSHVVFLTTLLEGAMKRECDRVKATLGQGLLFEPSELKGDPWTVRRLFLERNCAFVTPAQLLKPIRELIAVRNAVVHHAGDTSLMAKDELARLAKVSGISIDSSCTSIESTFVDVSAVAVEDLMEFIHHKTNEFIDLAAQNAG